MTEYEFIDILIHKKKTDKTIWEISDSYDKRYIEVPIGSFDMRIAQLRVMNELGKEGWSLGSNPYSSYFFTMQRPKE